MNEERIAKDVKIKRLEDKIKELEKKVNRITSCIIIFVFVSSIVILIGLLYMLNKMWDDEYLFHLSKK